MMNLHIMQKEIAILKSLGASPWGITLSFLITAVTCSIGGLLIGMPVGLILSMNANAILSFIKKERENNDRNTRIRIRTHKKARKDAAGIQEKVIFFL